MDWRDILSLEVLALEAKANGFDPLLADQARAMLRVLRGYEARVRQLALRVDHRLADKL